MAKMNTPVDHMFRAGQISGKQWKRLSGKQPTKFSSQKSKMAKFDEKETGGEGGTKSKSVGSTTSRHINGPDQAMGTPACRGGAVGKGRPARVNAIGDARMQKPNFPAGGRSSSSSTRKTLSAQQPSSSNPSGPQYGGPSSRSAGPQRLRPSRVA